jgi:hypothetical protein
VLLKYLFLGNEARFAVYRHRSFVLNDEIVLFVRKSLFHFYWSLLPLKKTERKKNLSKVAMKRFIYGIAHLQACGRLSAISLKERAFSACLPFFPIFSFFRLPEGHPETSFGKLSP